MLPTTVALPKFYEELVRTQEVLARKHLGVAALSRTTRIVARHLTHGQTNFLKMIWHFSRVYNPERQLTDHRRAVAYELPEPPPAFAQAADRASLYLHVPVRLRRKTAGGTDGG